MRTPFQFPPVGERTFRLRIVEFHASGGGDDYTEGLTTEDALEKLNDALDSGDLNLDELVPFVAAMQAGTHAQVQVGWTSRTCSCECCADIEHHYVTVE